MQRFLCTATYHMRRTYVRFSMIFCIALIFSLCVLWSHQHFINRQLLYRGHRIEWNHNVLHKFKTFFSYQWRPLSFPFSSLCTLRDVGVLRNARTLEAIPFKFFSELKAASIIAIPSLVFIVMYTPTWYWNPGTFSRRTFFDARNKNNILCNWQLLNSTSMSSRQHRILNVVV